MGWYGILTLAPIPGYGTVDFRTIGGNAKALSGHHTTHQILVAEGVSNEDHTVDRRCY